MNIDAYKTHIHTGLRKLEELVVNINDIIESRIEKNLKMVCSVTLFLLLCDYCSRLVSFISFFLLCLALFSFKIMWYVRDTMYVTGIEDFVSGFTV
jgi:hypothetical protein